MQYFWLLATWTLAAALQSAWCCSPKAVRSVFVGRPAAQVYHQAKKAKYLVAPGKTIGQKMKLSKGGVIMEQVNVKKLRDEIKFLENVEKTLKHAKKQDIKIAAKAAKTGKSVEELTEKATKKKFGFFKKSPKKKPANPEPLPAPFSAVKDIAADTSNVAKGAAHGIKRGSDSAEGVASGAAKGAAQSVKRGSDVVEGVAKDTVKNVGKKSRGLFKRKKKPAEPPPPPPPRPPPPGPPPPVLPVKPAVKKPWYKRG